MAACKADSSGCRNTASDGSGHSLLKGELVEEREFHSDVGYRTPEQKVTDLAAVAWAA
jgi:hypothetical protein